jgi:hypothetical protein
MTDIKNQKAAPLRGFGKEDTARIDHHDDSLIRGW